MVDDLTNLREGQANQPPIIRLFKQSPTIHHHIWILHLGM
jgi:hypothetical protein